MSGAASSGPTAEENEQQQQCEESKLKSVTSERHQDSKAGEQQQQPVKDQESKAKDEDDKAKIEDSSKHSIHPVPTSSRPLPRTTRPAPPKRLEFRARVVPVAAGTSESLQLSGVAAPPKRPAQLPASYAASKAAAQLSGVAGSSSKPNRYSWAQLQQHWREHPQIAAAHSPASLSAHFQGASRSVALVVNPMQMVNLSEHTKSKLIKIIEALKRFSEQWFSHVLLLMFLAVYACLGAYVFINFEASTEQREKEAIIESRQVIMEKVWRSARNESHADFSRLMINELEAYERLLARACASGMTSNSLENQWTFWGALFYSMTVFTTIGYGHLTPVTFAGRVATMVYAIFGIPILLMVLADLGKLLTRIIKFTFKQFRLLRHKLLHWRASVRTRRIISERTREGVSVLRSASSRAITRFRPAWFRWPSCLLRLLERVKRRRRRRQQQQPEKEPEEGGVELPAQEDATNPSAADQKQQQQQLITPPKQTKPISPLGPQNSRPTFGALAGFASSHHHNHAYPHYHGQSTTFMRSHSPGRRGGGDSFGATGSLSNKHHRKGSSSERQLLQQVKHHRNQLQVSRSSSSSVVLPPTPTSPSPSKAGEFSTSSPKVEAKNDQLERPLKNQQQEQPKESSLLKNEDGEDELDKNNNNNEANLEDKTNDSQQRFNIIEDDDIGDVDDDFHMIQDDNFDIPVSFALFLLVTYMMFGAVVFSIWEGWNFFDSLYFVFISMSTIGFGDLVPQHPKRMIGTFIYLLFGLALTSMCINVVQEKIHATFLRAKMQIGEKMGLDLDQIMADDYYEGSLMDEYCDAECLSETANDSDHLYQHHQAHTHNQQHLYSELNPLDSAPSTISNVELTSSNSIRASRSNHSFRSKFRRSAQASLPGHSSASTSPGSLLRRRPSRRQISRQLTPSGSTGEGATSSQQPDPARRSSGAVADSEAALLPVPRSASNQAPKNSSVCEPTPYGGTDEGATAATSDSRRTRLSGTRSQPEESQTSVEERPTVQPVQKQQSQQLQNSQVGAPEDVGRGLNVQRTRSAGSSRRSSVSRELNQLDDLILTLSRSAINSQDGPFGPLLGIPSSSSSTTLKALQKSQLLTRKNSAINSSSRPNSPFNSNNNNNNLLPIPRRGASMTSRRSFTPEASSGNTTGRKISSPLLSPCASRSGYLASDSRSIQHQQVSTDAALANSQMAIEELEAVKLSIV